ncbi:MAG: FHA domain-containing protein [Planctomycetes bacterium]|nr:FHA domain-containing protein [Planctomycetota bacterium]
MPHVTVRDESGEKAVELRDAVTRFGRASENAVVLAEKECSRQQFQIERFEGGWKLVDLESRNGTRVNGKYVNMHVLKSGDRIEVGKAVIVFDDAGPKPPAMADAPAATAPAPRAVARADRRSGHTTAVDRRREAHDDPRRGRRMLQVLGLAAGVFFALILVLIILAVLAGESPEIRRARGILDNARKLEGADPSRALILYESIQPSGGPFYKEAQARAAALRGRAAPPGRPSADSAEQQAFDALYDLRQKYPNRADDIVRACEEFKAKFPQSTYLNEVEKYLRVARDERAAARRRDVADAMETSKAALQEKDFSTAVLAVNRVYELYKLDIEFKQQIENEYARVVEAGRLHAREQDALAEQQRARGDLQEARRIITQLILALGDGSASEFEDQLKLARAKLDALKP